MEIKPKWRGWKEGVMSETLQSAGSARHIKGSIVRYRRFKKYDIERQRYSNEYEWHYLDQSNYNLIRSRQFLIEENK